MNYQITIKDMLNTRKNLVQGLFKSHEKTCSEVIVYKFNGKELDAETGLYYYGARYYSPYLSIWASVDPMSDKYPSMSPYMYCAGNPVRFVDLDGMSYDEFGVTQTGEIKLLQRKAGDHELYKVDNNGNKVDVDGDGKMTEGTDFVTFGRNDVKGVSKFDIIKTDAAGSEIGRSWGINVELSNSESADKIFDFITSQDNPDTWKTKVEWSITDLVKKKSEISLLTTGRSTERVSGDYDQITQRTDKGYLIKRHAHNHPSNIPRPSTGFEYGDVDFKNKFSRRVTNDAIFQIKTKHGKTPY